MIGLSVKEWAAWAPGLVDQTAWTAWAQAPWLPAGDGTPALSEVPAMQRRRIERLGRMAIQTAFWCQRADEGGVPLVFASRHGDVARSMELLEALVAGESPSPTTFGLSVHNAIAALYSILRGERGNYVATAGGKATVETACIEAAALLADGAPEVLLVVYDAPLPAVYAGFADEPDAGFAWCWRLVATDTAWPTLRLTWTADGADDAATALPHGLDVLRFLLAGDAALEWRGDGVHWHWRRDA
ncbi:Beta-ketoacyl synthase, N-terminal domain [Pseudoxanthomonas sp. CF385]|uniref:beta-ketoacyl synthase chain length factor n=1 Tax=Pseudoxanthomonas sp. CF385 TaxID=1881042 RepID=UPI00087E8C3E|nr:beta-ketoacyl synthase chain length factor [Pseudoxanthomonas sp. CF385]SDR10850.1 Beta-ketoacyl synthase, N-terminal domain [Pseudoxanthomonas sp. CF385]